MLIEGKKVVDESVKQISSFQKKLIKPIETGIERWDLHLMGGFFPSTIAGICGISSHGKSYELEKILANVEDKYGDEVVSIRCIWELSVMRLLVREMVKITGKTAKEILSEIPEKDTEKLYKKVCDRYRRKNIFIQPTPVTADEFYKDIKEKIKQFPNSKILVSCDNLENVLVTNSDPKGSMDAVLQKMNILIKEHPYICFIVLNQLNRDYYTRIDQPKKHLITESDLFGTGYMYKLCDVLMAKILPFRLGMDKFYVFSQNRYKYIDNEFKNIGGGYTNTFKGENNAFYQFLKSRDMGFEEYDRQDLFVERIFDVPQQDQQITETNMSEKVMDW